MVWIIHRKESEFAKHSLPSSLVLLQGGKDIHRFHTQLNIVQTQTHDIMWLQVLNNHTSFEKYPFAYLLEKYISVWYANQKYSSYVSNRFYADKIT